MLKALSVFEIFTFLFCHFGSKVNFKIYDVTNWATNNYNLNGIKARIFSGTRMEN